MGQRTSRESKASRNRLFDASAPSDLQPSEADQVGKDYAALKTGALESSTAKHEYLWSAQTAAILAGAKEPRSREKTRKFKRNSIIKPPILIVENDEDVAHEYGLYLQKDFAVTYAYTPAKAIQLARRNRHFVAAVIDIRMPPGDSFGSWETVYGSRTGLRVADELDGILSDAILLGLSRSEDAFDLAWFEARGHYFCGKDAFKPPRFARHIKNLLMKNQLDLKSFIVHGHDKTALLELKNYLQNRLGMPEPIILHEKASGPLTVIEKFEKHAKDIDVAFVLMTPDDFIDSAGKMGGRSRQNVIFELGYFVGEFGRKAGRVIMLAKDGVEIPSDLAGVIYIDISNGIEAAGEQIRVELDAIVSP